MRRRRRRRREEVVILYSIGREKKGKLRSVRNKTIMKGKEIKDLSDDSTVER